jgi:hypothetical protein
MRFMFRPFRWVPPVVLLALSSGCLEYPGPPTRYSVVITLDDALKNRAIDVDLIGGKDQDPAFVDKSVTDYFTTNDRDRRDAAQSGVKTFSFGPGLPAKQEFTPKDPMWKKLWEEHWEKSGANTFYILANLPDAFKDAPGEHDPRRRILPLGSRAYDSTLVPDHVLRIKLLPSKVLVETPPKGPNAK